MTMTQTSPRGISYNYKRQNRRSYARRVIARRKQMMKIAFVTMAVMISVIFAMTIRSSASQEVQTEKYYQSIQVSEGDTLWSIANEYASVEYHDTRDYVNEVKQLNHMSDDQIHEGQYLVVPFYAEAGK